MPADKIAGITGSTLAFSSCFWRPAWSIEYIPMGDYCIPNLELPQESRPIGKWGRMHRRYLETCHPIRYNQLVLSGTLWTYLADLNEQAQTRMETLIEQMKNAEGVTESLKATDPMAWVQRMNCIRFRAEEIVRDEIIYGEATI